MQIDSMFIMSFARYTSITQKPVNNITAIAITTSIHKQDIIKTSHTNQSHITIKR